MSKKTSRTPSRKFDFASWNYIVFLTLAFILLVVILAAMRNVSLDVRSRAGLTCPQITLPRAEDCATGWVYKRNPVNGCLAFFCNSVPTPTPVK